ncbi:MAG: cache domain-containing protein, partial [Actinomycetota bacterium]
MNSNSSLSPPSRQMSVEFRLSKLMHLGKNPYSHGWRPRRLILLLIVSCTTVAVSATATFSYQIVRGLILDNLKRNALLEVKQGSDDIDQWLATRKAELETVANTPPVRSMDWFLAEPYLQSEVKRLKEFSHLALIEPDGSYYTTLVGRANANVKDRRHFQKAMAGLVYVSDPTISRTVKQAIVPISAPIRLDSTRREPPIGVMNGVIKIDRIVQVVSNLKYGVDSYAFALNSQGVPIVHPNGQIMGGIDKRVPSFLKSADMNLAAVAEQMVEGKTAIVLTQIEQRWVYVAFLPLEEAEWSIALVIPRLNLEKELNALNLLAVVVGSLLAMAMVTALIQLRSFEETRAFAQRETLLNRLTGRIRASLEIEEILQTTVEELGMLLHLERTAFGWYDPQLHSLEIHWEYCLPGLPSQVGRFSMEQSDPELQLEQGAAMVLPAATALNSSLPCPPVSFELKAGCYLALPVRSNRTPNSNPEQSIGYLLCSHSTPWLHNREDKELLQAVADQLAIALTQSGLYTQTQAQVKLLDHALNELKRTQAQLVQSEKMSGLGQMVAGIAHEINNPVNFIYGNLPHTSQYLEDLLALVSLYKQTLEQVPPEISDFESDIDLEFIEEDLPSLLKSMRMGADRIREIVLSLRNFSRLDEDDQKEIDLHEGLENTLLLLQNRLKDRISVMKDYGNLPLVECYGGQLNQVFMNLLANAIDAVEAGKLKADSSQEGKLTVPTITI